VSKPSSPCLSAKSSQAKSSSSGESIFVPSGWLSFFVSGDATGDVKQKHRSKRAGTKAFGTLATSLQCDIELDKSLSGAMLFRKLFVIGESDTHLPAANRECTKWKAYMVDLVNLAEETRFSEEQKAKELKEQQS